MIIFVFLNEKVLHLFQIVIIYKCWKFELNNFIFKKVIEVFVFET